MITTALLTYQLERSACVFLTMVAEALNARLRLANDVERHSSTQTFTVSVCHF